MRAKRSSVRVIAVVIVAVVLTAVPFAVSGQQPIKREIPALQAAEPVRLSSGPFALPPNAASVDWMIVNDSTTTQSVTVTVFRLPVGSAKTPVAPGPLTVSLAPNASTHNANSVGTNAPFQVGQYYEVVVEGNSRNLLPSVNVWSTNGATTIPGTLIPSGSWVRLQ